MGLFSSLGKTLGVNSAAPVQPVSGAGGYGNSLGLRPELPHIGNNYRELRAYVEAQVGEILNPPPDLSPAEMDAMVYADAEEKAQHGYRQQFIDIQRERLARAQEEFETQLSVSDEQERNAAKTQGRLITHVELKANNAVQGSLQEHRLAGQLAAFSAQNAQVQDLVRLVGG
jgi:hypothetical protein